MKVTEKNITSSIFYGVVCLGLVISYFYTLNPRAVLPITMFALLWHLNWRFEIKQPAPCEKMPKQKFYSDTSINECYIYSKTGVCLGVVKNGKIKNELERAGR